MSAWDHVFSDLESTPFVAPTKRFPSATKSGQEPLSPMHRRQTMTAREISAFDEMFNMLFNAVSPQTASSHSQTKTQPVGRTQHKERTQKALVRLPRPLTAEEEQLLDAKKEEMELCYTDFELLQWAEREIFSDSIERLRKHEQKLENAFPGTTSAERHAADSTASLLDFEMEIQNPLYAPLLVNLMSIALHKFNNAQLACTLFLHAANLSFQSYIHACTTASFNMYLEALWKGSSDLKAVTEAVEEMYKCGVKRDGSTRGIVAKIRRELEDVMKKSPMFSFESDRAAMSPHVEDEDLQINSSRRVGVLDESEIFTLLERVDVLCADDPSDIFATDEAAASYSVPAWKEEWKSASSVLDSRTGENQDRLTFAEDAEFDALLSDSGRSRYSQGYDNAKSASDSDSFTDWTNPVQYLSDLPSHIRPTGSSNGRGRRVSTPRYKKQWQPQQHQQKHLSNPHSSSRDYDYSYPSERVRSAW